jgi:hypothetical protein
MISRHARCPGCQALLGFFFSLRMSSAVVCKFREYAVLTLRGAVRVRRVGRPFAHSVGFRTSIAAAVFRCVAQAYCNTLALRVDRVLHHGMSGVFLARVLLRWRPC